MACSCGSTHTVEHTVSRLQHSDITHMMAALEILNGSRLVQENKGQGVERMLGELDREECTSMLGRLLRSSNSRLCSTAAYLLGALAERDDWAQETPDRESRVGAGLVRALAGLLTHDDPDAVMNAAGAIASLAGSTVGRDLLLREEAFGEVLANLPTLLGQKQESTMNYAALVVARLSLCEQACQQLLQHPSAPHMLRNLAQCLAHRHTDTAMNAAFALGRLCGTEDGRSQILALEPEYQLVSSLQTLLCEGRGPGAGQTACFALSSLVTEAEGHALVLGSRAFPLLLDGLLCHLQEEEHDSAWFAALTVKVLVSRPSGVLVVREHSGLEERLQSLSQSHSISQELQDEVSSCLRKLERLSKPDPPKTRPLPSGSYMVSWEKCTPESGLEVTYSLLDKDEVLYRGTLCHMTLPNSALQSGSPLTLHLILSTDGGDVSPSSDPTQLVVESTGVQQVPGPPQQLRVIGCTPTQARLSWTAPEGGVKPKMYQVYCEETLLEKTTEPGAIVGGLSPGTLYQLGVCVVGPEDTLGERTTVHARTPECHDHAPSGLTMTVLGRHELLVSWGAPTVPLGRLFNYELRLNGRVAYLGTERAYTARRLTVNTAYTCTVTAITSRGRCQSRPVTKRTARDEYVGMQRCQVYSLSRQLAIPSPAPSPSVREVTEVREGAKKSLSPPGHLPKGQMSSQCERGTASNGVRQRYFQNRHPKAKICKTWSRETVLLMMTHFVGTTADTSGHSVSSLQSGYSHLMDSNASRIFSLRLVAMGPISQSDIRVLRGSARESVDCMLESKSAPHRPLHVRRAATEEDLMLQQIPLATPHLVGPAPHRAGCRAHVTCLTPQPIRARPVGDKASLASGMLMQHKAPRGGTTEQGTLPSITRRIRLVKCIQPTYPVSSELDRPNLDWMEQKRSLMLEERSKVLRQPTESEIKPRYSTRTNQTLLS